MAFSEYMNFSIVCTIFGKQFIEKLQMKNDKFFKSRGNKHARERKRVVSQVFLQQKNIRRGSDFFNRTLQQITKILDA